MPELGSSSSRLDGGALFAGRYRVIRLLGEGAMGAIYEVIDERTNGRRALKVMQAAVVSSARQRARFELEARVTGAIESEHLVRGFDAGVEAAGPFLVMELLAGEDLQSMLRRGALPPREVVIVVRQVARALEKTGAASIVHRDLKPANIFLSQREEGGVLVKILDFGLAKLVLEEKNHTAALGTPLYMAPEQIGGAGELSGRADHYALAHVAYALLTREPYYADEASRSATPFLFMAHLLAGPKEAPTARALRRSGVALPPGFDAWFARAAAVDPEARFPGAAQLAKAFEDLIQASTPSRDGAIVSPELATAKRSGPTAFGLTAHQPTAPPPHAQSVAWAPHAHPASAPAAPATPAAPAAPAAYTPNAPKALPPPARSAPRALWILVGVVAIAAIAGGAWALGRSSSDKRDKKVARDKGDKGDKKDDRERSEKKPSHPSGDPDEDRAKDPWRFVPRTCLGIKCRDFASYRAAKVIKPSVFLREADALANEVAGPNNNLERAAVNLLCFKGTSLDLTCGYPASAIYLLGDSVLSVAIQPPGEQLVATREAHMPGFRAVKGKLCDVDRVVEVARDNGVTANDARFSLMSLGAPRWGITARGKSLLIDGITCQPVQQ